MHSAACGVILSPAIITGTAGGQLTQASASTRPTARSVGKVSRGENMASRIDIAFSGTGSVSSQLFTLSFDALAGKRLPAS